MPENPVAENEKNKKNNRAKITGIETGNQPQTDKFVFFSGLILILSLLIVVIIIETFLNKKISDTGYQIIKVLLSISSALTFSQVPGILKINLPLGIKAAGGIAFGILIFFYRPDYLSGNKAGAEASQRKIPEKTRKLRLIILKSGDYEYTYTMLYSFITTLKDSILYSNYDLENPTILTGLGDSYNDPLVRTDFRDKVAGIFSRDTFDYYITIGSAASKAFLDYSEPRHLKTRHIFLGVTDPVALKLCNTLSPNRHDPEHKDIAGVAYCGNYADLPDKIHSLFPGRVLCYLYDSTIIEDDHLANQFRAEASDLIDKGILTIKKTINRKPSLEDFSDSKKVYFSWSTFDDAFANNHLLISKIKANIVSTTATHAEYGLVPIAVTTSDSEIGVKGAGIIMKHLFGNMALEDIDIAIPLWQTYVNVRLAGKFDIPDYIIKSCNVKY